MPGSTASRASELVKMDQGKCFPEGWEFKSPGITELEWNTEEVLNTGCILESSQEGAKVIHLFLMSTPEQLNQDLWR